MTDDPDDRLRLLRELENAFEDAPNLWHVGGKYPPLNIDEFLQVHARLLRVLQKFAIPEGEYLLVDDLWGDRTQMLYLVSTSLWRVDLLKELMISLASESDLWRIVVVREPASSHVVWVYPTSIEVEIDGKPSPCTVDEAIAHWRSCAE
jgi:hypothetical protein